MQTKVDIGFEKTSLGLFKDLTLVPYDKNLINKNLLSRLEIKYLNNYHKEVFEKLNSFLNLKELSFLKKICSPL